MDCEGKTPRKEPENVAMCSRQPTRLERLRRDRNYLIERLSKTNVVIQELEDDPRFAEKFDRISMML